MPINNGFNGIQFSFSEIIPSCSLEGRTLLSKFNIIVVSMLESAEFKIFILCYVNVKTLVISQFIKNLL